MLIYQNETDFDNLSSKYDTSFIRNTSVVTFLWYYSDFRNYKSLQWNMEPLPGDSKSSKSLKLFLIKTVNCPPSYYLILAIQVQESLKILKAIKFCPSV